MGNSARAVLDDFIVEARKVWGPQAPMSERVSQILPLMQGLVAHPAIRDAVKSWPSTEGVGNLLLYTDPDFDFVVNAVVRERHDFKPGAAVRLRPELTYLFEPASGRRLA